MGVIELERGSGARCELGRDDGGVAAGVFQEREPLSRQPLEFAEQRG